MSVVDEDVELRDLLAETLEKNGCLAHIRAQLRASVFLALDEDIKLAKKAPLQNLQVQNYLYTPEGRAMFFLVREFLEFFNLQFSVSVYEVESYLDTLGQYEGRQQIASDLGLDNVEPTVPLLQQVLKVAQLKSKVIDINLNLHENGSLNENSLNVDSTSYYNKTESFNSILPIPEVEPLPVFNSTFNVINLTPPVLENAEIKPDETFIKHNGNDSKIDKKEDDTYEDTSSIAEDSEPVSNHVPSMNASSESYHSKKTKSTSPTNKTRVNADILPSLYNKEYKNKSNIKEIDKLCDAELEYEDDFVYSNASTEESNLPSKSIVEESQNAKNDLKSASSSDKSQLICSKKTDNSSSISEYIATETVNSAQ